MKSGRKNLKRASEEKFLSLKEGESIMQVVSLRGSNLIEVLDPVGVKSLAFFPAKFQKSFWIKRGSYLVVDASGRDEALESGSKVACVVSQVLFHDQIHALEKSPEWPAVFKNSSMENNSNMKSSSNSDLISNLQQSQTEECEEESGSDEEDDGLPPLEANTNRNRPYELHSDDHSDSDSDSR
ncbi:putative RNA-binding protein EIF1AD [Carex littledalei]|uniref:Putative RNA-binding protein EIF1AD n=1 Tax=Carex littledalei TaxID=544730 RepID=A0A833QWR1_9POAL|nr:putative RNA-binding protein EIF1AD [Carex littledalei]